MKIHQILEDLTEKSAYYCRLVSELFKKSVLYNQRFRQIFSIIGDVLQSNKLFRNMSADLVTKI